MQRDLPDGTLEQEKRHFAGYVSTDAGVQLIVAYPSQMAVTSPCWQCDMVTVWETGEGTCGNDLDCLCNCHINLKYAKIKSVFTKMKIA